jgi:hypothetical protein
MTHHSPLRLEAGSWRDACPGVPAPSMVVTERGGGSRGIGRMSPSLWPLLSTSCIFCGGMHLAAPGRSRVEPLQSSPPPHTTFAYMGPDAWQGAGGVHPCIGPAKQ